MRKLRFTLLALLATTLLSAQSVPGLWETIDENQIQLDADLEVDVLPLEFHTFSLDFAEMGSWLAQAPLQKNADREKALLVDLPMADGNLMTFEIYESSVMMPQLAAKFPMIRSYQGVGKDHPEYTVRLDYNTLGFMAQVWSPEGIQYITPYAMGQDQYYMSFLRTDYPMDEQSVKNLWSNGARLHRLFQCDQCRRDPGKP